VKLQKVASLFDIIDNISDPMKLSVSEHPLYMQQIGQVSTNIIMCVFLLLLLNLSFKFYISSICHGVYFVRCFCFFRLRAVPSSIVYSRSSWQLLWEARRNQSSPIPQFITQSKSPPSISSRRRPVILLVVLTPLMNQTKVHHIMK